MMPAPALAIRASVPRAALMCVLLTAATAPVAAAQSRAAAPPAAIDTTALAIALRNEMDQGRVPGAAMAIVQDGRVLYARGFGVRNVETGDGMNAESVVRIGSITKSFTGLATLLLEAQGRLSRTAPIGTIAPDLSPALAPLTLEQLLTHTAGLADEGAGNGPQDDAALGLRVRSWGAERFDTDPGDIYSYASPGYWLAGHLLERVAGRAYADAMDSLVFRPLGMRRTTLRPTVAMTHPFAADHRRGPDGSAVVLRPYPNDVTTWPSGSIFSSVNDLARYAIALLDSGIVDGERVLPASVVATMLRGAAAIPGSGCRYSTGFSVCEDSGVTTVGHYGFRGGSGALFTLVPQKRLGIVILANRGGAIMSDTEAKFLAMAGVPAADESDAPRCIATRAPSTRTELVGTYTMSTDTMRIVAADSGIALAYNADPVRLYEAPQGDELVAADAEGCAQMRVRVVQRGDRLYLHTGMHAYRRR